METLIILSVIVFFVGLMLWAWSREKASYNGGYCTCCDRSWRKFCTDSQGGRGYKCDTCGHSTWVSYWGIDG